MSDVMLLPLHLLVLLLAVTVCTADEVNNHLMKTEIDWSAMVRVRDRPAVTSRPGSWRPA